MDVSERFVSLPTYRSGKEPLESMERDLAVMDLAVRKKPGENPLPLRQSNTNWPIIQIAVESLSIPPPGVRNYQIHSQFLRNDASILLSFPAYTYSTAVAPTLPSFVNTVLFAILMCCNNLNAYV